MLYNRGLTQNGASLVVRSGTNKTRAPIGTRLLYRVGAAASSDFSSVSEL
jgi:hypothetical protein